MATITMKSRDGKDKGSLELADAVFGIQPNVPVMHQVVTAQLAARRSGTQSTKTRSEVSGGGKKPMSFTSGLLIGATSVAAIALLVHLVKR